MDTRKDSVIIWNKPTATYRKNRTVQEKKEMISLHPFCAYCGSSNIQNLIIEHIYPLSSGGLDDISNITIACSYCNLLKSYRNPDMFHAHILYRREKVYQEFHKQINYLKRLRFGKPITHLHTEHKLSTKLINLKIQYSFFTTILFSLEKEYYKSFYYHAKKVY